ncbi:DMT family transporter [Cognatiyoonia sp.]|uniref:DMT family transporter n=1 Tax=Cognatiyoonia sp. TaxID=2211652 RepID=UPI003F69C56A
MADRVGIAMALMIGFCITAPILDVCAKLAATEIPVGQITAARFLVQAALMIPMVWIAGQSLRLPPNTLSLMIARALCLLAATYCFIAAIRIMPIADALAIAFVEPFIILLMGYLVFRDAIGPRRIMACAVGFTGALLVIQPSLAVFGPVAFYPLGTAVTFAAYMILTRGLAPKIGPLPMQAQTAIIASAICLPILYFGNGTSVLDIDPVMPQGIFWIWLLGVGLAAAGSHLMMTYALSMAPASTLAPLHYLEIVTAVAFGYLIFGDFPNWLTWTGIGVIVSSGLYVIFRERQQARLAAMPAAR